MNLRKYEELTLKDLKINSGPHVWPCSDMYDISCRFFAQRPELIYLRAKRIRANKYKELGFEPEHDIIEVRISRVRITPLRSKEEKLRHFFHHIQDDDSDQEDVQRFLEALRMNLKRCFSSLPIVDGGISLRYHDPKIDAQSLTTQRLDWI